MAVNKSVMDAVLKRAAAFVSDHAGRWDHTAWEQFVQDAVKTGVPDTDEARRNLGNLLESGKYFFALSAASPAKPAATPKKKAPAKKSKAGSKSR